MERVFEMEINGLFDIAHQHALDMVKISEDKEFLRCQRKGRIGYMTSVDHKLSEKGERSRQRKEKESQLSSKTCTSSNYGRSTAKLDTIKESCSTSDHSSDSDTSDREWKVGNSLSMLRPKRHKKINILPPQLTLVKQFLLQTVEHHRNALPNTKKTSLVTFCDSL